MVWLSLLQLVQNRVHLYNFLLLKILLFNHWLSGLAQEAWGSCSGQVHPPAGLAASPLGRVLRAGLMLMEVPMWLGLRAPRLVGAAVLCCARALGLVPKWLGLSAATCMDLLLSCLHGLMLAVLLLSLLTWRLCQNAHRCGLGWLLSKVGGPGSGQAGEGRPGTLGLAAGQHHCGSSWWPPPAPSLIPSRLCWATVWCQSS